MQRMGDSALLLEVDSPNTAQQVRATLLQARLPGVREIVPSRRHLLLVVDPLAVDLDVLADELPDWDIPPPSRQQDREVEIQVHYDGADLDSIARLTGLKCSEIIERHTSRIYTVAFLGFAPGFPYLVGLDPRLQLPRLDTPRPRVPTGSVAIADDMTVIYPHAMPGGWRILGHTTTALFDSHQPPYALLAPGDQIRFVAQP